MRGYTARAMRAGLSKVGEPSSLRGLPCGNAVLNRSVNVARMFPSTEADNYVGLYDVASISTEFSPTRGDHFDHPDGAFVLDRLVHDNGAIRQYIVVART